MFWAIHYVSYIKSVMRLQVVPELRAGRRVAVVAHENRLSLPDSVIAPGETLDG